MYKSHSSGSSFADSSSETPIASLLQQIVSLSWAVPCVYVAAKLGIADLLKDGPKRVDELAVLTQTNELALYRVLGALASMGVFLELEPRRFTLTPITQLLRSDVPGSLCSTFIFFGEELHRYNGEILYSVKTGNSGFDSAFNMSLYDYFKKNASSGKTFNNGMASYTSQSASLIAENYDFSQINSIVDVGGGLGMFLSTVLKANPHLKGILFDSPEVIGQARDSEYLKTEISNDRCQLIPGNFFETIPGGADAYLVKLVLNYWEDDQATKILSNCHRAMAKNGKLIIIEYIDSPGSKLDPGKLFFDLSLLIITSGRVRTESEFSALLQAAGFSQPRFVTVPTTPLRIIESMRIKDLKLENEQKDFVEKLEGNYQEEQAFQLVSLLDPEKDFGKDMAVTFNLGKIKIGKNDEESIEGHFLCVLPFGHFPPIINDRLEEADRNVIDWAIKIGLITKNDKYYKKFMKLGAGKAAALMAPDIDDVRLFAYSSMFIFVIDDLTSDSKPFNQAMHSLPPTYQQVKEAIESFISIIRGHYTHLDEDSNLDFPLFKPLCAALLAIRQEALLSKRNISHFMDEIVNYMRSVLWERECVEHTEMGSDTKDEYMFSRHWTIAVRPSIEAINLLKGTMLSEDVRKHPLYERYLYQACIHVGLVNDILSLKKEVFGNEYQTDNLVLIKHKKHSLQKSIYKVMKKANDVAIDLKKTALRLKNCFPNDFNLDKLIESVKYLMDGNIYWSQKSKRYDDFEYNFYRVEYKSPERLFSVFLKEQLLTSTKPKTTYDISSQEEIYSSQSAIGEIFSHKEKDSAIKSGLRFLEGACSIVSGFQARIGDVRELLKAKTSPYMEIFSSTITLDLLSDTPIHPKVTALLKKLVIDQYDSGSFNFFKQKGLIPNDIDATSFCTSVLLKSGSITKEDAAKITKRILSNVNQDGILQIYFPPRGDRENRIDPAACANAMHLIYQLEFDTEAKNTEDFLYRTLEEKSYLKGTWYYPSPDAFLYFLCRAIIFSPRATERFSLLLTEAIKERIGTTTYPLDLAMRILTAEWLGLLKEKQLLGLFNEERQKLESLQKEDGSWPKEALYKAGRSNIYFGNKGITTAFAVRALQAMQMQQTEDNVIDIRPGMAKETDSRGGLGWGKNGGLLKQILGGSIRVG